MRWIIEYKKKPVSNHLLGILRKRNKESEREKNESLILIKMHLCEELQEQYAKMTDPEDLREWLNSNLMRGKIQYSVKVQMFPRRWTSIGRTSEEKSSERYEYIILKKDFASK